MEKRTSNWIHYVLILVGLSLSAYLFNQHLNSFSVEAAQSGSLCSTLFGNGCDAALKSSLSSIFGLPLAGWGILYYLALTLLLLTPMLFGPSFTGLAKRLIFLLSGIGLIMALTLLTLMAIKPELFCPFCTGIHVVNITLFFLLTRTNDYGMVKCLSELNHWVRGFFKRPGDAMKLQGWTSLGIMSMLLLLSAGFLSLQTISRKASEQPAFIDSKPIIAAFESQQAADIHMQQDDIGMGNPASPVQLIVFTDFYCPTCRDLSKEMAAIKGIQEGKYRVTLKHFPLSSSCNPAMKGDLHPLACEAAKAVNAAAQQGKFQAYHDALFATEPGDEPAYFRALAAKLQLDMAQFENYMNSAGAEEKIKADIAEGIRLGLTGTPTLYLNGKKILDRRLGLLAFMMKHEYNKSSLVLRSEPKEQ